MEGEGGSGGGEEGCGGGRPRLCAGPGGEAVQPSSGTHRPNQQGAAARGVGLWGWGSVRAWGSTPRALGGRLGFGQACPRRRQPQVLQNGAYPIRCSHVRQNPSPASTSHADEHVQVERPSEQLGPIYSRRLLLQQLLAGRCLGRRVRLLRTWLGELLAGRCLGRLVPLLRTCLGERGASHDVTAVT